MRGQSFLTSIASISLIFCEKASGFSAPMTPPRSPGTSLSVKNAMHSDDSAEHATPLQLTTEDMERFQSLKTSQTTMPILILDSMLPKQEITIDSSDPKMARLVHHCLEHDCDVGILGLNPSTGTTLSRGVTASVDEKNIQISGQGTKSVILTVTGESRMEVQSQAWLDPTGSFYLSNMELIDSRKEPPLSLEQQMVVQNLSDSLPKAIKEWSSWVIKTKKADKATLREQLTSLGHMPSEITERAFWVAAALNPLPKLDVCLEIRPAMLSCTNNYERMVLACQAVRSSIDHMSEKRRLF